MNEARLTTAAARNARLAKALAHPRKELAFAAAPRAVVARLGRSIVNALSVGADDRPRHALRGGAAGMGATATGAMSAPVLRSVSARVEDAPLGFADGMLAERASGSCSRHLDPRRS